MKKIRPIAYLSAALVTALSVVEAATAVTIDITPESSAWTDPQAGVDVVIDPTSTNGDDPISISWGNPNNSNELNPTQQKSSYVYNGESEVTFELVDDSELVKIGTFTHNNFQITGTPFEGVNLNLALTVAFGSETIPLEFSVLFDHLETPNNANPCAAGGSTPCPDLVTIVDFDQNIIEIDGQKYLTVLGFSADGGETIVDEFLTSENLSNSADLFLLFEAVGVPWQTDLAMATAGLVAGSLVYSRARKKLS